jgi:PIN domain nuclease of toxin-antitoxin system
MAAVVLDASAVLAFLRAETGADAVLAHLGNAAISTVNLQEVIKELVLDGLAAETIRSILAGLHLDVLPHDEAAAFAAGVLVTRTKRYGRGLGDRTCLALGMTMAVPVVTADREWKNIQFDGLTLEHIR